MSDPVDVLRQLDPQPAAKAPSFEQLWPRVADANLTDFADAGVSAAFPADGRPHARASAFGLRRLGSRMGAAITVSVALAIGVGAVLSLHTARKAGAPQASVVGGLPSAQDGVVGVLGVLRRPQKATDRTAGTSLQGFLAHLRAGQPVASLIRLAMVTPWGRPVVLIPMSPRTGTWPPGPAGTPHGLRLATYGDGGGGCCISATGILRGEAWSSGGDGSLNYVVLVVPDRVARVTLAFRHLMSATVHSNVAAFQTPSAVENLGAYTMTWYSATGAVLRRFPSFVPTPATQRAERSRRIGQAQRNTTTMAPAIGQHFALFAPSAVGTFRDGPETVTIAQPPISSWPTFLLDQWTAAAFDLHHVRAITARGATIWILATSRGVICAAGAPGEGVGGCSADPGSTSKFGMTAQPALRAGGRLTIGIVSSTNHTVTVRTTNGHTRVIPVTHGVFVTGAISAYHVAAVNGHTTWHTP